MKVRNALWVGGPPGKTMINIQKTLSLVGINVIKRWKQNPNDALNKKHRIPDSVDVVLLNHEMCSHNAQDHIKALCKRQSKRFVLAHTSTAKTITELYEKGLIDNFGGEVSKSQPSVPESAMLKELLDEPIVNAPINSDLMLPEKRDVEIAEKSARLFEIKGIAYVTQPCGPTGARRRGRPVVVGDALFLSTTDAGEFLDVHNQKLSNALAKSDRVEINGYDVYYPDFDTAYRMLSTVVSRPKLDGWKKLMRTDESATPLKVEHLPPLPMAAIPLPGDDPVEKWRRDTRELRDRLVAEKDKLTSEMARIAGRIQDIDIVLNSVLPNP